MGQGNDELRETASFLNSAAIHLLRGMRDVDKQSGLTPARLSALSVLVFAGPCSLGRLARIEGVANGSLDLATVPQEPEVVHQIARRELHVERLIQDRLALVQLDLARRQPHPDSARSVQIFATTRGTALMQEARGRRIAALTAALTRLSARDRARVVAAAPVLGELAALLRE